MFTLDDRFPVETQHHACEHDECDGDGDHGAIVQDGEESEFVSFDVQCRSVIVAGGIMLQLCRPLVFQPRGLEMNCFVRRMLIYSLSWHRVVAARYMCCSVECSLRLGVVTIHDGEKLPRLRQTVSG